MRTMVLAVMLLSAVPAVPALAAPTCQTAEGDTIRCGTQGAMPAGWRAPSRQWHPRATRHDGDLPKTLIVLVLLFALIALLPEFDGRRGSDWDKPEDNAREKKD